MATARIIRNLPEPPLPATHIYRYKEIISPNVERMVLRSRSIPAKRKRKTITQEDKQKIRDMRGEGKSVNEIAAATGHSPQSIRSWCGRNGIKAATRKEVGQEEVDKVMGLWEDGKNRNYIAAELGIPYSRVKYIIRTYKEEA